MATGAYIAHHHVIPHVEVFSYTARGVDWIYPVGGELFFYLLFKLGGYSAISLFCAFACAASAFLLTYKQDFWTMALVTLSVPCLASSIMPRASLFTIVLFIAFTRVLTSYLQSTATRSRLRSLWLLPVLMLLWVNLHTGFIAGLFLIFAYMFAELLDLFSETRRSAAALRLRQAGPWLLLTLVATAINPWGIHIYATLVRQQAVTKWQSVFIQEWQPAKLSIALHELNVRNPDSARWWLLVIALVVSLACVAKARIGPALILLTAGSAFLMHQRLDGPFAVLVCLIGGSAIDRSFGSFRFSYMPFVIVTVLLVLMAAIRAIDLTTDRTYVRRADTTVFGLGKSWWIPEDATNFLITNHLPGNIFSSFNLGSYLVWQLGNNYPDFADGRYIPFGNKLFEEQRRLTSLPLDDPEWLHASSRYQINTVIFPISRVFGLGDAPLLADCESKSWTPVYLDTTGVVFVRNDSVSHEVLQNLAINCKTRNLLSMADQPVLPGAMATERYEKLANASAIYAALGRYRDAADAADFAEILYTGDPTLAYIKAQIADAEHHPDEAEHLLRDALRTRQTDAGWYDLALLYIPQQRFPEAIAALRKSADLSYSDYSRFLLIGNVYLLEHAPQPALDAFARAADLSPYQGPSEFGAQLDEGKAAAYMQLQQPLKAIELQRAALRQSPTNQIRKTKLAEYCSAAGIVCE